MKTELLELYEKVANCKIDNVNELADSIIKLEKLFYRPILKKMLADELEAINTEINRIKSSMKYKKGKTVLSYIRDLKSADKLITDLPFYMLDTKLREVCEESSCKDVLQDESLTSNLVSGLFTFFYVKDSTYFGYPTILSSLGSNVTSKNKAKLNTAIYSKMLNIFKPNVEYNIQNDIYNSMERFTLTGRNIDRLEAYLNKLEENVIILFDTIDKHYIFDDIDDLLLLKDKSNFTKVASYYILARHRVLTYITTTLNAINLLINELIHDVM